MSALRYKARRTLKKVRRKYDRIFHGNCLVLLYHRVTNAETDPQLLAVSPVNFDAQLEFLKQNYRVLTVDEFSHHLREGIRFPEKSVLITFDDGYADNYLEALPILEKHHLQALFYISTGTLNTSREFWWDAVERIVLLSGSTPKQNEFVLNDVRYDLRELSSAKKIKLYNDLLPALRRTPAAERDRKIDELTALFHAGPDRTTHRALTFEELKKMYASQSSVIGAHTHLHPSLAALTYEAQYEEIATSKKILEALLGTTIKHFSYPFGTVLDYNADTMRIVKDLKFELVAANYPDPVTRKSNRYAFPRFLVRNWELAEFRKQMRTFSR